MSGFVRRDESGEYVPGGRIFQLGLRALSQDSLVDLAWPAMGRLVDQTGESVYLSVRGQPGSATYIATLEGTRAVRHRTWTGATIPMEGTAAGLVLSGAPLPRGFAVAEGGVETDATAVAVPIRSEGRILGAISIVAPSFRCTPGAIADWGALLQAETADLFSVATPELDAVGSGPESVT
ncbi:IclR family transcriptional regulator [Microbacterium sp. cx-55]|nr:IclR family transcriptional regulator [Microbacterium sp. cx-55]